MSQENVELVRSIYAEWERGDYSSAAWAVADIECVFSDGPSPRRSRGLAAMAEASRDYLSAFEEYHQEAKEFRALDSARVLVLVQRSGRGKRSGLELGQMQTQGAHVFHVRDGKVTSFVAYWDRDRALADLGLAE